MSSLIFVYNQTKCKGGNIYHEKNFQKHRWKEIKDLCIKTTEPYFIDKIMLSALKTLCYGLAGFYHHRGS